MNSTKFFLLRGVMSRVTFDVLLVNDQGKHYPTRSFQRAVILELTSDLDV